VPSPRKEGHRSISTAKRIRRLVGRVEEILGGAEHEFETGDGSGKGNDCRVHQERECGGGGAPSSDTVKIRANVLKESRGPPVAYEIARCI